MEPRTLCGPRQARPRLTVRTGGREAKKRRRAPEHDSERRQSKGASPTELLPWQGDSLLRPGEAYGWERTEPHQWHPGSISQGHKMLKNKDLSYVILMMRQFFVRFLEVYEHVMVSTSFRAPPAGHQRLTAAQAEPREMLPSLEAQARRDVGRAGQCLQDKVACCSLASLLLPRTCHSSSARARRLLASDTTA